MDQVLELLEELRTAAAKCLDWFWYEPLLVCCISGCFTALVWSEGKGIQCDKCLKVWCLKHAPETCCEPT